MAYKSKETLQAYQKRYREQHRDQAREYLHAWRLMRRTWAEAQLGGKCVRCGTSENLHFDHIDPATKTHPVSRMWGCAESRLLAEIQKCQLLCKTCHKAKSSEDGDQAHGNPAQHGTSAMYGYHHCRCDQCVEAKRLSSRNHYHAYKTSKTTTSQSSD